jgi:DNA-3-methyladenine glycosylase II
MKFTIKPIPPYDFDLSARIFSSGDPQIREYQNGKFSQVLRVGRLVRVNIESEGYMDQPLLRVELESHDDLSSSQLKSVSEMISRIFNLNLDLNPFYHKIEDDKVMEKLVYRLRGLKSPITPTIFEALIDSIIEQQISLKAAHSIEMRLIKSFGDSMKVEGETYYAYPSPKNLAHLKLQDLRDCGVSFRKAEYIRDLSFDIMNGELELETIGELDNTQEMIEDLTKIRGVGVWTAELTLLRGLRRFDALPADDIGLRRAISHFYRDDAKISATEAREIASSWGEWKGLAGFYLIMAEILDLSF